MNTALAEAQLSGQFHDKMMAEISHMKVRDFWERQAKAYGTDGHATTWAASIKRLEIDALRRAIERVGLSSSASILEVGCGNGQNIAALSEFFPRYSWTGVDYVPAMVSAAEKNAPKATFLCGDVLHLDRVPSLRDRYDVVFTDRLLINLSSVDQQKSAIDNLAGRGEALILIENSRQTKDAQNDLREIMGLPRRRDAEFNLFLDDEQIVPHLRRRFETVEIEDFGSLHDILLYVLLPAALGDTGHYDYPLMEAVADLCSKHPIPAGSFGQNRLYLCRNNGRDAA